MTVWVDVGGYRLAVDVTAGDAPATVFISGRGDDRTAWGPLLPLLRGGMATVVYDRAGMGDSDPCPHRTPRPYSALADELVAVLQDVSVPGPYLLVGHSFGAVIARSLASRHPALVAGLVFVDGSVDEVALWSGITTRDGQRADATLLDYQAGAAELASAQYPAVPAVCITRTPGRSWPGSPDDEAVDQRWSRHQQSTADRFDAVLVEAADSGHYVQHEAAALVALAVDAAARAIVAGDAVIRLHSAKVAAAGGTLLRPQQARSPGTL